MNGLEVFVTFVKKGHKYAEQHAVHEKEHVKSDVFGEGLDEVIVVGGIKYVVAAYRKEKSPQRRRKLLEEHFRLRREKAFQKAKKEIFSTEKDRVTAPTRGYGEFFNGGAYDYLAGFRDQGKTFRDWLGLDTNLSGDWKKASNKVLVEEYKKIFDKSLDAYEKLKNQGWSIEEINSSLRDTPLEEWDKAADQLLSQAV